MAATLDVRDLVTQIPTRRGVLTAVDHVSFAVQEGESFGLVGESGSGKSMTCRSILRLVPTPGKIVGGRSALPGRDLLRCPRTRWTRSARARHCDDLPGPDDGAQPGHARGGPDRRGPAGAPARAVQGGGQGAGVELLRMVGIASPEARLADYP